MSDAPVVETEYPPDPAPPDDPWPPDHVPPEPLNPVDPPDVVPEPIPPTPPPVLYDVWERAGTAPPYTWTRMGSAGNVNLTYEEVTQRCLELDGFTSMSEVPVNNYVPHHVGVEYGKTFPPS